jgi:uncharacterized protein CbrC (UPF0167 family)
MASKVPNDFKAAFALLLTIMKINYSTTTALNYSQTVFEWTIAGLITDGKIEYVWTDKGYTIKDCIEGKNYSKAFAYAKLKYKEAIEKTEIQATPGRKEWAQKEILERCFEINQVVFPIALSEGLLDLKDIAAGIGNQAMNIPSERDR